MTSNATAAGGPAAGVLILHSPGGRARRRESSGSERLRRAIAETGMPSDLVLPSRGNGTGTVVSAIDRLAARCGGRAARIGVLAIGRAADDAVLDARADGRVRAFAFLSGRLGKEAKETLAAWPDAAVLCVASTEDRPALRDMAGAYLDARSGDADIRVLEGMGSGAAIVEAWAERFPDREPLERGVASWLRDVLAPGRRDHEVSFVTEDGWEIHGDLLVPESKRQAVPGVVLLHSGRTDRYVFARLAGLLARAGCAALSIDWRGRGRSTGKGTYFDLSAEERAKGGLDAKAAVEYLAPLDAVDAGRIALVGIVHGAEYAVRGSLGDPRVRALVLLTGYMPASDAERDHLTSGRVHVMYVTSEGHGPVTDAMRALYASTQDKLARLVVYPGGAIGYQLFELDGGLERTIAAWLEEALA